MDSSQSHRHIKLLIIEVGVFTFYIDSVWIKGLQASFSFSCGSCHVILLFALNRRERAQSNPPQLPTDMIILGSAGSSLPGGIISEVVG